MKEKEEFIYWNVSIAVLVLNFRKLNNIGPLREPHLEKISSWLEVRITRWVQSEIENVFFNVLWIKLSGMSAFLKWRVQIEYNYREYYPILQSLIEKKIPSWTRILKSTKNGTWKIVLTIIIYTSMYLLNTVDIWSEICIGCPMITITIAKFLPPAQPCSLKFQWIESII